MKRLFFGASWCMGGMIRYYLLINSDDEACGVEVEYGAEREVVCFWEHSKEQVESLLDRLCRGRVTPTTLKDVIEDWQLDSSCNFPQDSV